MFYETAKNDHGLPYNPFKAIVAPRPIGWISTMSAAGQMNLAPYSFFNGITDRPPMVMFSSEGHKDSVAFAQETGEFVVSVATYDLRNEMNATSGPFGRGESEFAAVGLEAAPSRLVRPPRVAASPCALECKVLIVVPLTDLDGRDIQRFATFGQVVGVHIDDRFIVDGKLDTAAMQPIARCGYHDYAVVDRVFALERPTGGGGSMPGGEIAPHAL